MSLAGGKKNKKVTFEREHWTANAMKTLKLETLKIWYFQADETLKPD